MVLLSFLPPLQYGTPSPWLVRARLMLQQRPGPYKACSHTSIIPFLNDLLIKTCKVDGIQMHIDHYQIGIYVALGTHVNEYIRE